LKFSASKELGDKLGTQNAGDNKLVDKKFKTCYTACMELEATTTKVQ
jgi:hypothetical protein